MTKIGVLLIDISDITAVCMVTMLSLNYNTKHEVMMTNLSTWFRPTVPDINITTRAITAD